MPMLRCTLLEARGVVRLGGGDMRTFIQGLISNDIALLAPDHALYAALLTPQGKYLFDFLLLDPRRLPSCWTGARTSRRP